jgi:hypothetical protein
VVQLACAGLTQCGANFPTRLLSSLGRSLRTLEPTVPEPTVAEILEKAKQLCRLDGMLWSNLDFQNPMAQRPARMADVAARRRYLKRAQTLLGTQSSTNRVHVLLT